jgi:hypothetical protein
MAQARLAVLAALSTLACGGNPASRCSQQEPPTPPPLSGYATPIFLIPLNPYGWDADQSGYSERTRLVVDNQADWEQAWARLMGSRTAVPSVFPVDFTNQIVVVAAMGTRPSAGYSILINGAASDDQALRISVAELSPGPSCVVAAVLSQPVTAASLPRSSGHVEFVESSCVDDCR